VKNFPTAVDKNMFFRWESFFRKLKWTKKMSKNRKSQNSVAK